MTETVVVIDFGGQYNQLICRRVRELNVHSVMLPYDAPIEEVRRYSPIGIIFTGGLTVFMKKTPPYLTRIYSDSGSRYSVYVTVFSLLRKHWAEK